MTRGKRVSRADRQQQLALPEMGRRMDSAWKQDSAQEWKLLETEQNPQRQVYAMLSVPSFFFPIFNL